MAGSVVAAAVMDVDHWPALADAAETKARSCPVFLLSSAPLRYVSGCLNWCLRWRAPCSPRRTPMCGKAGSSSKMRPTSRRRSGEGGRASPCGRGGRTGPGGSGAQSQGVAYLAKLPPCVALGREYDTLRRRRTSSIA